ncbi:hypothetical protein QBC99_002453 [Beijerinckia sp. GAS462]|nr:hypothetical protein [Beijerinckia sp. GAS462]SEC43102.1 hypothetical protein SAMN05443249_2673 [Beijerinckia sp. 28-YEA-48]
MWILALAWVLMPIFCLIHIAQWVVTYAND